MSYLGKSVFTPFQASLFPLLNSYADVLFANQSFNFDKDYQNLIALHSLNHIYKYGI